MSVSSRLFCVPEELEDEYCAFDHKESVRPVRTVAAVVLGLYTLFGFLGMVLYDSPDPLATRIYFQHLIPGTLVWIAATYTEFGKRNIHRLTIAALFLIVIPGHIRFNLCLATRASLFEPSATIILSFLMCVGLRLSILKALGMTTLFGVLSYNVHAYTGAMESFKLSVIPFYILAGDVIGLSAAYLLESARRRNFVQQREIEIERAKSDNLLLNVLPVSIAKRLKAGEENIVDHCEKATVLFADIVGYTRLAGRIEPKELMKMLETIFSKFDGIMTDVGMEKIKTIGDAYMAVSGVPVDCINSEKCAAEAAIRMRTELEKINRELGLELMIRIGIHTGPVMAGVIGCQKFSYDLWGDTVNFASRLESHGLPGRIQISEDVREALNGNYRCIPRGPIDIKGKGERETFWLEPASNFSPLTTSTVAST